MTDPTLCLIYLYITGLSGVRLRSHVLTPEPSCLRDSKSYSPLDLFRSLLSGTGSSKTYYISSMNYQDRFFPLSLFLLVA